jgi:hypothetical protein
MTWLWISLAYLAVLLFDVGLCAMGTAEDRATMALALWRQFSPRRVI